jgi:tetratricopeptide (TPR) repeat protein
MLSPQLTRAQALKEDATALRNRGDLGRALRTLEQAVRQLKGRQRGGDQTADAAREVRAELADTYGMIGGIHRRAGDLEKELFAYTHGGEIEAADDLSSTYNRSNIVALRVSAKGENPTSDAIREQVAGIIARLKIETAGPRRDEWWAWSDLAQFHLLYGEPDEARRCYSDALRLTGPTAEEIERHATILSELADRTADTVPEIAAAIRAVLQELPR